MQEINYLYKNFNFQALKQKILNTYGKIAFFGIEMDENKC